MKEDFEGSGDPSLDAFIRTYRPELAEGEARFAAECLFSLPPGERDSKAKELLLDSSEALQAAVDLLRERWEAEPGRVRDDAEYLYGFLLKHPKREKGRSRTGKLLFDQREYFLGELALIAGTTSRNLARREEARRWFRRADRWFLTTADAPRSMTRVLYQQAVLLLDERQFDDLLELLPGIVESFDAFEMSEDALKCRTVEGNVLKEIGRLREAADVFREVCRQARALESERLLASGCVNLLQIHAELDEPAQALAAASEAVPLLKKLDCRIDLAKAQCGIGLLYRRQRNVPASIAAFREAQGEFKAIQMRADAAALHLIIADLLMEQRLERQAVWEIQAALPIIDELKLVPEGFAALDLLRQALRFQFVDRKALQEVHGFFRDRG